MHKIWQAWELLSSDNAENKEELAKGAVIKKDLRKAESIPLTMWKGDFPFLLSEVIWGFLSLKFSG